MTEPIVAHSIQEAMRHGVQEFCICPGKRNAPFIAMLTLEPKLKCYYFYDERSAASFALGRAQATGRPVAAICTSGTAVTHMFGAAMEAYYTDTPLMLITADRPRSHRGKNTPQSCEQVGIYGLYTPIALDLAQDEPCDLSHWNRRSPVHINVCLEEPVGQKFPKISPIKLQSPTPPPLRTYSEKLHATLDQFLAQLKHPFVIVGGLKPQEREAVCGFLTALQAPVFLEGISGLREDPRLQGLAITRTNGHWSASQKSDYPIDGILRIGGTPTFRLWRDLEDMQGQISVLSINDVPFSGLSWGSILSAPMKDFFAQHRVRQPFDKKQAEKWLAADRIFNERLQHLLAQEPTSEPGLVAALSAKIPAADMIYLGNSLPIREWDLAATRAIAHANIYATRALAGIDGQTSIFVGLSQPHVSNWGLIGDLTALHDASGPWIFKQLPHVNLNLTVINNGGGKIFATFFEQKEMQNCHDVTFAPLAALWNLTFEQWHCIPEQIYSQGQTHRLIEIIPDEAATQRFNAQLAAL